MKNKELTKFLNRINKLTTPEKTTGKVKIEAINKKLYCAFTTDSQTVMAYIELKNFPFDDIAINVHNVQSLQKMLSALSNEIVSFKMAQSPMIAIEDDNKIKLTVLNKIDATLVPSKSAVLKSMPTMGSINWTTELIKNFKNAVNALKSSSDVEKSIIFAIKKDRLIVNCPINERNGKKNTIEIPISIEGNLGQEQLKLDATALVALIESNSDYNTFVYNIIGSPNDSLVLAEFENAEYKSTYYCMPIE